MRLTLTLFTFAFVVQSFGQTQQLSPTGTVVSLAPRSTVSSGGDRDILFEEDFDGGIPADWTNEDLSTSAQWQYRGLNSTPNLEVGTQGSCLPDGVIGDPIQSPTQGNGFVIFDSNWWDNPNNPCTEEFMGSGSAPGPHFATLSSPILDFSGTSNSFSLEFYQYYKAYDTHASVQATTDGGSFWFEIYNNDLLDNPTASNNFVSIPLGAYLAGASEAQFRFVFSGQYYFWQIDDIRISTTPEFDMSIEAATYGDFDITDPAHPTGFEFMEYTRYPAAMAPLLKFSAQAQNNGLFENPGVRLNVQITDESNAIEHTAQSLEGFYLFPGPPMEVRAGQFQMPTDLGEYEIISYVTGINGEAIWANDYDTAYIEIHAQQMARDHKSAQSIYYPTPEYFDVPYEIGNVFLNTAENMQLLSLSVGLGLGTTLPTNMYGVLYEIEIGQELQTTLIATTPSIEVTNDMLNGYSDEIMTNLLFEEPITLQNGKAYLAMVGAQNGGNYTVCALSGRAPAYTSWVHHMPDQWNLVSQMPMVRLNFDSPDQVIENISVKNPIRVFPNPATEQLFIETERSFDGSKINITNNTGQIVQQSIVTYPRSSIDISAMSPGIYIVQIGHQYKKVVIQ